MPINPLTGMEEEVVPTATPLPPELATLTPPPVVYPDAAPVAPVQPLAPAPIAPPVTQAPIFKPVEQTETVTTTKQSVMTPEEKKLMKERDKVVEQQIQTSQAASEIAKAQANIEMQKQAELSQRAAAKEERLGQIMAEADTELAQKTAEREEQYNKFKNMEFKDYWEQKGTGSRVIAAIAVGLGQFGAGLQGQSGNTALDIINKQIEMDFNKQKANIQKQQEQYQMSKDGVAEAKGDYATQLKNLDIKEAAAYESVAAKYASMLAAQGVPQAQIQADANVQALQAQALDKKLQVQKDLRSEVTTNVKKKVEMQQFDANGNPMAEQKPLTEGQGKATGMTMRMIQGVKEYDAIGGLSGKSADKMRKHMAENYSITEDAGGLIRYILKPSARPYPEGFSQQERIAWNALREIADSSLRLESGALVGDNEILNRIDAMTGTTGDGPDVMKQKRGRMSYYVASAAQQAGPSSAKLVAPPEPQSAPSGNQPKLGEVVDGYRYVGKDPTDPKNWEKVK